MRQKPVPRFLIRLTACVVLCCLSAGAYAQKMNLNLKQTTISSILKEVTKQTGYDFVYSNALKDVQDKVDFSYNQDQVNISELLDKLFQGKGISFKISGKQVMLAPKEIAPITKTGSKVKISGVITDDAGEILPGVTVQNTSTGTAMASDIDGKYSIEANPGDKLRFTYIGMTDKEEIAGKSTRVDITLQPDAIALGDVVVTGYQTLSKERSTGSFAKVGREKLELIRNNDLKSMMEGQVAGYTNGQIRGMTTMNAVAQPMVVIDGFPVENTMLDRKGMSEGMPDLNPEDVESITFLKDAAAASIYGARAANGVIVITTKKAKEGKTEIEASATWTIKPYNYYTGYQTNSADIVELEREWAKGNVDLNTGGATALKKANQIWDDGAYPSKGVDALLKMYTGKISQSEADAILNDLASRGNRYTDQMGELAKRNSLYQQYNIRIGKTTNKNTVNASATYWRNREENLNTRDNKISINLNNTLKIAKWLTFDAGAYIKYGRGDAQTYNFLSPSSAGFSYLPYNELVDASGNYVTMDYQIKKEYRDNIAKYGMLDERVTPMNEMNYRIRKSNDFSSRLYGKLRFDFTSWLNYDVMFQYENAFSDSNILSEKDSYTTRSQINNYTSLSSSNKLVYNLPNGNTYYEQNNKTNAYNFRHQINLNRTFAKKHNVVFLLGNEIRHTKLNYKDNTLYGYDPELLSWANVDFKTLASGVAAINGRKTLSPSANSYEIINRFVSFYSNLGYTYDNRYVLSGSIRWDRSNLWGSNIKNQNKPLWSVGGSWLINNEKFFHSNTINQLKLRASYGIGGNIGRNTAPYLIAMYFNDPFLGITSGLIKTPPNADIRWEKTATTNIGVDIAAFNNRLSGTVEYYHKYSSDLLATVNGSPTQGLTYITLTSNNGEMVNSGVELTVRGDIIQTKAFNWNATLLYAYNKNTVKKINVIPTSANMKYNFPNTYATVGEAYGALYAYQWAGLNKDGEPQVYNSKGEVVTGPVSDSDTGALIYCGTTTPVHSGTFSTVLSYKNFDLSAMLILEAGHKLSDYNIPFINMTSGFVTNNSKEIVNRWKQAGDENTTDVPKVMYNDQTGYNTHREQLYRRSDKFIYNASNIRLHNISLAYRLPKSLCEKMKLGGIKFRFNVENVAVFAFDKKAQSSLNYRFNPTGSGKLCPNYVFSVNLNF